MHTHFTANAKSPTPALRLGFGMQFPELYEQQGLRRLHQQFLTWLQTQDRVQAKALDNIERLRDSADRRALLTPAELLKNISDIPAVQAEFLLVLGTHLQSFLVELFHIEQAWQQAKQAHADEEKLLDFKKRFVQRKALRTYAAEQAAQFDPIALLNELSDSLPPASDPSFETNYVQTVTALQATNEPAKLDAAARYAAWAVHTEEGRFRHRQHVLFKQAQGVDLANRMREVRQEVQHKSAGPHTLHFVPKARLQTREGFSLTEKTKGGGYATDQAKYCSWCHSNGKDSCSHGASEEQAGCPLEERISEFQYLRAQGDTLAALAVICIDNPMLAATGHRICNDCVKACIFQSQDPVDIPQVETQTLLDVLALPWGVEMYSLLTRWNPLRLELPYPLAASGKTVMIAGQGPAGFTLAHHLMNLGHRIQAIDGLRITPLELGPEPVYAFEHICEDLATREQAGFGGVAEYGITVRWDKNFLKLIRLLLERRETYSLKGGIRLGSNLSLAQVWELGVDHLALAMGAGKPGIPELDHALAKGARTASDFLMSLQLTGAARMQSLGNILLRLPVLVIGGGLTAVDTATEALAYYPVQVELLLKKLEAISGSPIVNVEHLQLAIERLAFNAPETEIALELGTHGLALRHADRADERLALLQSWGGSTIVYRKALQSSPAYRLNHEELEKAMAEGIVVKDQLSPVALSSDANGFVSSARFATADGEIVQLSARCILYATGTSSNSVLADEYPATFGLSNGYLSVSDERISLYGDMHAKYAGNVVKAMVSAKHGARKVHAMLSLLPTQRHHANSLGIDDLTTRVVAVNRLNANVVEVILHSPLAARNFEPGQFYRLQFASSKAHHPDMEGLALTGAWVDKDQGLLSMVALEMGGSSNLCAELEVGEECVLMGPTGVPSELPEGKTVLLAGGGLGNAVLLSIGKALLSRSCKVLYFAGYKFSKDLFKQADIEAASTQTVWCCDQAPGFAGIQGFQTRTNDIKLTGNLLECIENYGQAALGASIPLSDIDYLLAVGSNAMMAAVSNATSNTGRLKPLFPRLKTRFASVNSPMQCMMKEVCGQCVQRLVDPSTGEQKIVFTCHTQDQAMDRIDWACLRDRLSQNTVWEKINRAWLAGNNARAKALP